VLRSHGRPSKITPVSDPSTVAASASPSQADADLETLASAGRRLRDELHFDWSSQTQHIVHALRFASLTAGAEPIALVAIIGGASSGKSTVFNNLLGGHLASFVTARGHATRGVILAVHERRRTWLDRFLERERVLLPEMMRRTSGLDDAAMGTPEAVTVVTHSVDPLRDVLLLDTPDLTSEASRLEGDVALALLPWFDRLVLVIDAERWFDRQAIDQLTRQSRMFGQDRLAAFNRSLEAPIDPTDRARLEEQAVRMDAAGMVVIDYHRGRGCRMLDADELAPLRAFVALAPPQRAKTLLTRVSAESRRILTVNEARAQRLVQLRAQLAREAQRSIPTAGACLRALMNPTEREQLDVAARVLRLTDWRDWLGRQSDRIGRALGSIPVVGAFSLRRRRTPPTDPAPNREATGIEHFKSICQEIWHGLRRVAAASAFRELVPAFDALPADEAGAARTVPESGGPRVIDPSAEQRALEALADLDRALDQWNVKVAHECKGVSSNVAGAVGAAVIGVGIVLVAVQGPIAALTLPAAKAALAGALGHILGLAGGGALAGRHLHRLVDVAHEKLVGSVEFNAVQDAAENYRQVIADYARQLSERCAESAQRRVLRRGDPLRAALERVATS